VCIKFLPRGAAVRTVALPHYACRDKLGVQ